MLTLSPLSYLLPVVQAAEPATVDVSSSGSTPGTSAFAPDPVYVKPGDTVRWTNDDSALHTVTSGTSSSPDGKFGADENGSPMLISPRGTFEHVFAEEGEYQYFCQLHPFIAGTVVVGDTRSPPYPIAVRTDRSFYSAGETITISGKVSNVTGGQPVLIQIFNPDGAAFRFDPVNPSDDGSFSYPLTIGDPPGVSGVYKVNATYSGSTAHASFYSQAPQFYLKVNAVSGDSPPLSMWLTVQITQTNNAGASLTSYTPASFALDTGKTYPLTASDYLDSKFLHWQDGSTNRTRVLAINNDSQITAYYRTFP